MLTNKIKAGYGIGDLGNNLLFQLSVLYLLYFYTDVAGISPGVVGIIFVIARIWDAVNDPLMGMLIDSTNSKHGRSRVYIRYATLPLAIATILLFWTPDLNTVGKVVYASVTYLVWGMLYTMVSIPYASMTAELSKDPEERTSLSSVRMLFMLGGVIVVAVLTEPLTSAFDSPRKGYLWTALLYSALAFLFFQLCFAATANIVKDKRTMPGKTERVKSVSALKTDNLKLVFRNTQLLILTAGFLIGATAEYIREASIIYFATYNMGDSSLMPIFMGVVVLAMIAGNLVIPVVSKKLDKKGTYMVGGAIGIVGSVIFHLIPHDNLTAVLIMAAISSFGFTVVSTLGWAMLPDTVEYGEALTGVRTEGLIYSFFSFSQKLATALAGGIVAMTLQVTGYVPKSPDQIPSAITGILSTITIIPAICLGISMLILRFYSIDKNRFNEITQSIKRTESAVTPGLSPDLQ